MNFESDVVSGDGRVYSWDINSPKFQLKPTEFLKWYGLINAIASQWKIKIQDNPFCNCHLMTKDKMIVYELTFKAIIHDIHFLQAIC